MTRADHNDLAERVREELHKRPPSAEPERVMVAVLSELVYDLRRRVQALEAANRDRTERP